MRISLKLSKSAQGALSRLRLLGSRGILSLPEIRDLLNTIGKNALDAARKSSPGKKFPSGWELITKTTSKKFSLSLVNTVISGSSPLMSYLEYGTRPHLIRPKNKRALFFTVQSNQIFAKLVRHPGTRPYGMIAAAQGVLEEDVKRIQGIVTKAVRSHLGS